jgi:hypothetical protein
MKYWPTWALSLVRLILMFGCVDPFARVPCIASILIKNDKGNNIHGDRK